MFCSQCGEKNEEEANFCRSCGNELSGNIIEEVAPEVIDYNLSANRGAKKPLLQYAYHGSVIILLAGLFLISIGRWIIDVFSSRDWWVLAFVLVFGSFAIGFAQMIFVLLFWLTNLSVNLGDWLLKVSRKWSSLSKYILAFPLSILVSIPAALVLSFVATYILPEGVLFDEFASALIQLATYTLTLLMFAYVIPRHKVAYVGILGGISVVLSVLSATAILPIVSVITATSLVLREVQILEKQKSSYTKLSDSLGWE